MLNPLIRSLRFIQQDVQLRAKWPMDIPPGDYNLFLYMYMVIFSGRPVFHVS